MNIELKPEQEQILKEQIENGRLLSVDDFVDQALEALQQKSNPAARSRRSPAEVVAHLRQIREGVSLGGLRTKELRDEGRP